MDLDARPSRRTRLFDVIGRYAFREDATALTHLRIALERARDELGDQVRDNQNRIGELRATVARALRMLDAANWEAVTRTLQDGTQVEVYRFKEIPEEQQARENQASRANAGLQRMNIRRRIQGALLEPSQSTLPFLQEALAWAKAQPVEVEPQPDEEGENYDAEWNRRAVVMTAALVARDCEGADREDALTWARPILLTTSARNDREYFGNDQIEHNTTACAALGIISLFLRDRDKTTRDMILELSGYEHPAVLEALGQNLLRLGEVNDQVPRSIIRIVMASAVHPRRALGVEQQKENDRLHREAIDAAITIEQRWLDGEGAEPSWPELASWQSRPRRGIRLGNDGHIEDDDDDEPPSHYVHEQAIAKLAHHLIRFTISDVPSWVKDLAVHLMAWTAEANGPHGDDVRERDHRPDTWNIAFFDFIGVLSVALPHAEVVDLFLNPIVKFNDEAFHDVMASFLRGYDRATVATDTKDPENPGALRALLADRIKRARNYRRLGCEKVFTSETHAGDALNAMFYQPSRWANTGRPTIPDNWSGLQTSMATLIELVVGAPTSGYLASLLLNLVESSHDKALIPFVVQAMAAWCEAYGVDRNFWAEKNIGSRVCAWLDSTLTRDATARAVLVDGADELLKSLDVLVQSGVAQARILEEKITNPDAGRKAG